MTKETMKAVFLDRDGTINQDDGYTHKIQDFRFLDFAIKGMQRFYNAGYGIFIITNQSGIARGYYNMHDINVLHSYVSEYLRGWGIQIEEFLVCPHHPDYTGPCNCRKPGNELLERAIDKYNVQRAGSWLIGDRLSDQLAATKSGLEFIRILGSKDDFPDETIEARDILEAYNIIQRYSTNVGDIHE
ncbi:HAD family hydrolase [Alicyclobacillus curvatus]|nr:HAD family hydrolase [Alicyclobacillus curvatus]